jgi:hypothetical protein
LANPHPINPNPWREDELQIIRDQYPAQGATAVAALLNRTTVAVKRMASILRVRTIAITSIKLAAGAKRQAANTSSDIHYFETWSPNVAWLLGYIWADGSISCDSAGPRALQFSCQERDGALIHAIRDELKATTQVTTVPAKRLPGTGIIQGQPSVRLKISSRFLANRLVETHGIRPNKSNLDNPFPTNIPDEFMGHFARGNLDGDGTVSYSKAQGMNSGAVEFIGDGMWLRGFQEAVCRLTGLPAGPMKSLTGKALHRVRWAGKGSLATLYAWLYPPGEYLFLVRKRDKFREIFEYQRDHVVSQSVRDFTPEEDQLIRDRYPTEGTHLCAHMGRHTRSSVETRAAQLGVACAGSLGRVKWTAKEDQVIRDLYPTGGLVAVAQVTGRGLPAIRLRASMLRVKKMRR